MSGFRREVDENCALPGYYAASNGNLFPKFLGHLLKMGQIGCLETSVRNYRYSLNNSPEEHSYLSYFFDRFGLNLV
jgi:hypothetical protein